MKPEKIYIDNSLLVRWFLWKFNPKKYKREPQIIRFLSNLKEVKKYISLISVAELVHTLEYGEDFQKYKITLPRVRSLIEELQSIVGFDIIINEKIKGVTLGGIIITPHVVKFIDIHRELPDCIHVDISKRNELCFITYEKKLGRLKPLYENIMTENKLMKQFK